MFTHVTKAEVFKGKSKIIINQNSIMHVYYHPDSYSVRPLGATSTTD